MTRRQQQELIASEATVRVASAGISALLPAPEHRGLSRVLSILCVSGTSLQTVLTVPCHDRDTGRHDSQAPVASDGSLEWMSSASPQTLPLRPSGVDQLEAPPTLRHPQEVSDSSSS